MKRLTNSDKVFDTVNLCLMILLMLVFMWPLWFVLIASISNPDLVAIGEVVIWPKGIMLEGYQRIMNYYALWRGYGNTIIYTVIGTFLNMVMSICMAYPLSDKNFRLRGPMTVYYMITMYFGGGLIPHYLLYKNMGIIDTRWAMIFPSLLSIYNSLIIRSYFQSSIPGELKEAATIDGANAAQYLWRVVLPLSKPVFAVVGLYYLVGHWNNYMSALYYIYDEKLMPLQSVLRRLLMTTRLVDELTSEDPELYAEMIRQAQVMQYGVIIVAAIPVLVAYPFVQKYFVKGVMIGAIKG